MPDIYQCSPNFSGINIIHEWVKEMRRIEKLKLALNRLISNFGVKFFSISLEVSVRGLFGLGGIGVVGSSIMSLITLESVVGSMLVSLLVALIAKFNSMEI